MDKTVIPLIVLSRSFQYFLSRWITMAQNNGYGPWQEVESLFGKYFNLWTVVVVIGSWKINLN